MRPQSTSRKDFLKAAGLLCAGFAFPQVLSSAVLGREGATAPSSRIRMGHIGVGGKGGRNLQDFMKSFRNVEHVAVCDVKEAGREKGQRLTKLPDSAVFTDFREMLAKVQLDAVVISTPDHLHVPISLACIRRGIAVYVEKPMCRFLAEGRLLADTASALDSKLLVGSQQRTVYPAILKTVRAVQAGRLGELKTIRVLLHRGNPGVPFREEPVPSSINYDLWLGPAPYKPYSAQRVGGTFRQISDYSEGSISDWGAHHLDIVQMTLGTDLTGPSEIEGSGLFPVEGLYDVPYKYDARMYYPKQKVTVVVTTDPKDFPELAGAKGLTNGIRFEGSEGTLFCDRTKAIASRPSLLDAGDFGGDAIDRDAHKSNFISMITQGVKPAASAEIGHRSATLCHLVYTAVRLGSQLNWNPAIERFEGANAELGNRALYLPRREEWYSI